jgi:hypothetical protein
MKKYIACFLILMLMIGSALAMKNKVAQSGMTYLAISMGSRETAMGDAGTAITKGINGLWHNPAVLADIDRFAVALNQVDWLIDTKLYGTAFAASLGKWGSIGLEITYMDYGEIIGTRVVDKSVDYRGFILTGDIGVEDYAVGLAYARRINDKFSLGLKVKRLHERLGRASYVVSEYDDPATGDKIRTRAEKDWKLNDWGLDIGTSYDVGWKSLTFAMAMQNFSRDMKYWNEEFQTPMVLRMGLAMDVTQLFAEGRKSTGLLVSLDALHPNDHTERIHVGAELSYLNNYFLRAGYKFNHEVESLTAGIGAQIKVSGLQGSFDYAYGSADYFEDVHRFTITFSF